MRIAVFGAGGVGGYFGARLVRAGQDVRFIARGPHLEALRSRGLKITSPLGDFTVPPVTASDTPQEIGPVEVVLLTVKTWQLDNAARSLAPLIDTGTCVIPLLNGVEAGDQVARVVGRDHVVPGVAKIISHIAAPGHIHHVGADPHLAFGEFDGARTQRVVEFRDALKAAGVSADIPADITVALWEKFLFVVSVGGVGAVTRAPVGVIRAVPQTRRLLGRAMREIYDLGRARSVKLPPDAVAGAMAFADTLPEAGTASLQRDIADGRPSELEAWNGAVVRLGKDAGVETPVHGFIYAALLPQEKRARRPK